MTRAKLASAGFVAARNWMRQHVLDDAKSLLNRGRSQSATTCDSSYAPKSAQYCSLLQSTTPTVLRTTKYYSSTTPYYKDPVLQSTPLHHKVLPLLLRTTKCYSSTAPYHKVLVQQYSVLQSPTPVLLCPTVMKYYSITTLYYKVKRQYYPVLQSSTPVLCTTKYYSSTTKY